MKVISITVYLTNQLQNTFVYECNQSEVENLLSKLNPKKATGRNSIPTDILHILKKDISYPL